MFWPPDENVGCNTANKIVHVRMRVNAGDGLKNLALYARLMRLTTMLQRVLTSHSSPVNYVHIRTFASQHMSTKVLTVAVGLQRLSSVAWSA